MRLGQRRLGRDGLLERRYAVLPVSFFLVEYPELVVSVGQFGIGGDRLLEQCAGLCRYRAFLQADAAAQQRYKAAAPAFCGCCSAKLSRFRIR